MMTEVRETEKKKYFKMSLPTEGSVYCVCHSSARDMINAEIEGLLDRGEVGGQVLVELIEMTDDEFEALGEFDGF